MWRKVVLLSLSVLLAICIVMSESCESVSAIGAVKVHRMTIKSAGPNSFEVKLTASKGTAFVKSRLVATGYNVTKISGTVYLQRAEGKRWVTTKSWSGKTTKKKLIISTNTRPRKGRYRTKNVMRIYVGNKYQTLTKYSGVRNL